MRYEYEICTLWTQQVSKDLFTPISNHAFWLKPIGGLWGSMPDSDFNWKAWCLEEDFQTEKLNECFYFTLKPGSKILSIRKSSDLEPLPKLHDSEKFHGTVFLDFEKLAKQYDAIELFVYGDFDLQGLLGTWDCDCVLVLNPDAVQEISNNEEHKES